MATGIVGSFSGNNATFTYTPAANAKIVVALYSTSGLSLALVNNGIVASHSNGSNPWNTPFWAGAGQAVTITLTGSPLAMISVIEE